MNQRKERASITQSNTARLIRRKLRGCLPLSINFNSVHGPPTEGAPPLATSVGDSFREKEVRVSLSLPSSVAKGNQEKSLLIAVRATKSENATGFGTSPAQRITLNNTKANTGCKPTLLPFLRAVLYRANLSFLSSFSLFFFSYIFC